MGCCVFWIQELDLRGGSKLIIIVTLANRSVSLEVEYQDSLTKVGIHLVSL
jgi:hypothetical protein